MPLLMEYRSERRRARVLLSKQWRHPFLQCTACESTSVVLLHSTAYSSVPSIAPREGLNST